MAELNGLLEREVEQEPWVLVDLFVKYTPPGGRQKTKKFTLDRRNIEAEHVKKYREQYAELTESEDPYHQERLRGQPTPDEFAEGYTFEGFEQAVLREAQRLLDEPVLERGESTNEYRVLPNRAVDEVIIVVQNKGSVVLPN